MNFKQKLNQFCLLLAVSLTSQVSIAATQFEDKVSSKLSEAIALLASDLRTQAYPLLEEVFANSAIKREKIDAALILAYAENKNLKLHKRHFYAHYITLNTPSDSPDRWAFLRIAGDGFFEDLDLASAQAAYELLAKSEIPAESDYGIYKLGWVDLNKKAPQAAFLKWFDQIQKGQNRKQDLRSSFIRDLGRSWAETTPPTEEENRLVEKLNLSKSEAKEFVDGIAAGMHRLEDERTLALFRETLQKSKFYEVLLPQIFSQGLGFNKNPCAVLDWIQTESQISSIGSETVVPWLNSCNAWLHKKHVAIETWKQQPEIPKLISFYRATTLRAIQRWPRVVIYKDAGLPIDACSEGILLITEENTSKKKDSNLADAFQDFIESCRIASTQHSKEIESISKLLSDFENLLEAQAASGVLDMKSENPYYGLSAYFLKIHAFRSYLLSKMTDSSGRIFKGSLIPAQIIETLNQEEKEKYSDSILTSFAPTPILDEHASNNVWIELLRSQVTKLVSNNKHEIAIQLLNKYIPIQSLGPVPSLENSRRTSIWLLWALELPSDNMTLRNDAESVARFSLRHPTPEIAPAALALGTRLQLLSQVWSQWREINLSPNLAKELVETYLQSLVRSALDDKLQSVNLSDHPDGKRIGSLVQYLKGTQNELNTPWKEETSSHQIYKMEVMHLEEIRIKSLEIYRTKLKFNAKLPKLIESKSQALQSLVEALKKQVWPNELFAKKGRRLVSSACDALAMQIENLDYPPHSTDEQINQWKTQLSQITKTFRQWKSDLIADGGAP